MKTEKKTSILEEETNVLLSINIGQPMCYYLKKKSSILQELFS